MKKLLLTAIVLGLLAGIAFAEWKGVRKMTILTTSKEERFIGSAEEEVVDGTTNETTKKTLGIFSTKEECNQAIQVKHATDFELDKKSTNKPGEETTIKESTFPRYSIFTKINKVLREDKTGIVTATMDAGVSYSCEEK